MVSLSFEKRRNILLMSNFILLLMTSFLAASKLLTAGFEHLPLPALSVMALVIGNLIYLRVGGDLIASQRFMMWVLSIGLIAAILNTGGYMGAAIMLSPILPMMAILWFNAKTGWKILSVLVLVLTGLFLAERFDLINPSPLSPEGQLLSHYIAIVVVSICSTWITWAFNEAKEVTIIHNQIEASTDHLTQLANRRALDTALLREVGRARRDHRWLSFVLIDVDHFKRYNDNNGHQAGDACLVAIANLIANSIQRSGDFAARYGGEEFALILPDTDANGAYHIAEKLRMEMEALQLRYIEDREQFITITLGVVAVEDSNIQSIESLIKEADSALYRGKLAGRNQVVLKTIDSPKPSIAARKSVLA